jgi:chemotaxis-related protein WspD
MKSGAAIDDCWNRIGVNGDQSCPQLAQVVHCRNCPVYAGAAQRNLQRPIDDAYRAEWAAHFRQPPLDTASADQAALVFRLGREWLALPAASIDAVAPLAASHKLPHRARAGLLGIVNVAGKLTPMMALDAVLGIDGADAAEHGASGRHVFARLLVMQYEGQRFAMRVADLHGIARYRQADLATPPATVNKGLERLVLGVLPIDQARAGGARALRVGVLDAALLGHQLTRLLR